MTGPHQAPTADVTRIYWSGSYPHNKISSGLNRLLARAGSPATIAFNRKQLNARIASVGRGFHFCDGVHVELLEAARQLLPLGFRLVATHDLEPLNGWIDLRLAPADASVAAQHGPHHNMFAIDDSAGPLLDVIYVRGLAHTLIQRQADSFSACYDMDYVDVDEGLANGTLDTTPFHRFMAPREHHRHLWCAAWFCIKHRSADGGMALQFGTTSGKTFPFVARPADVAYLTRFVAPAIALAQASSKLPLVKLTMDSPRTDLAHMVLTVQQAEELLSAVTALAASTTPG